LADYKILRDPLFTIDRTIEPVLAPLAVQDRTDVMVYPVHRIHELLDRVNAEPGGR